MAIEENEIMELEQQVHSLLNGTLEAQLRGELLLRVAQDAEVRELFAEMLTFQSDCRETMGYSCADALITANMPRLHLALAETKPPAATAGPGRHYSFAHKAVWLGRIAALILLTVSVYVAMTAQFRSQSLETRLAGIQHELTAPAMALTTDEIKNFRQIWNQVALGNNTFVLVSNGGGEIGSIASRDEAITGSREVLLIQCHVLDSRGNLAYRTNLLVPGGVAKNLQVAQAGRIAGYPVSLDISQTGSLAQVGFCIRGDDRKRLWNLVGKTRVGSQTEEIGSFKMDGRNLRVFVKTQRMGFSTVPGTLGEGV